MSMFDEGTRAVFDELEAGTAFNRALEDQIGEMGSRLEATFADLPTEFNAVSSDIANRITGLADSMPATLEKIAPFAEHVTNQFNGLAQNIGLFSSAQRLENEMAGSEDTNACGDMHDFFGSLTQAGPTRIGDMNVGANAIIDRLQQFKTAYADLQSIVQTARSDIQTALQSEISATNDSGKVSQLQGLLSRVQSEFASGPATARTGLLDEAKALLTGARQTAVEARGTAMQAIDQSLEEHSSEIDSAAGTLGTLGDELGDIVAGEKEKLSQATKRLTTLGEASSIRSLFSSNPCAQTLLGYVGTDSLLSKLG